MDNKSYYSLTLGLAMALTPVAQAQQIHPWSQRNADASRTCQSTFVGPTLGTVAWTIPLSGRPEGFAVSSLGKIATHAIFNEAWWSHGVYVNLYRQNSTILARQKMVPYPWGFAQNSLGSSAWAPDGSLVVPSTNGQVVKLTGGLDILWSFQHRDEMMQVASPAVLPDGSIRHWQMELLKITPKGQASILSYVGGGTPSVNPVNKHMATGGAKTNEGVTITAIYYFGADGRLKWTYRIFKGGGSIPVFGPDGTLYAGVGGSQFGGSGRTIAFRPDGVQKWSVDWGGYASLYGFHKDGYLLATSLTGIAAFNASNGSTRWTTPLGGQLVGNIAIDSEGRIYVPRTDGVLYCLDRNGNVLWNKKVCDQFTCGPAITSDGGLVIGGKFENTWDYRMFMIR